jgi:two-component system, NtrC family, response regulator GlrR
MVVDDDPGLLRLLTIRLRAAQHEVEPVPSADAALEACARRRPDLVLTDLRMADMDGIDLLKELQSRWPGLSVILLTAHGTIPDAVRATQAGAFSFLTKPVDKEHLQAEVRRALKASGFADAASDSNPEFVTRSPILESCLAKARLLATTDSAVLVSGEPGTGKEFIARSIHKSSKRRERPLVAVDCSAIDEPDHLSLADELRTADGGTLLLLHVGDLPFPEQDWLANALSAENDQRARAGLHSPPNVRVMTTSEQPLEKLLDNQGFSADLLNRLGGVSIEMPSLAKRREDIPLLVSRFLDEVAVEFEQDRKNLSPEALEVVAATRWPGNVRELRQVIREVAALTTGPIIPDELIRQAIGHTSTLPSFDEARDEFTRNYLIQLLRITEGNVSQAARLARRNRTDFYKLMTRHKISPDEFKK